MARPELSLEQNKNGPTIYHGVKIGNDFYAIEFCGRLENGAFRSLRWWGEYSERAEKNVWPVAASGLQAFALCSTLETLAQKAATENDNALKNVVEDERQKLYQCFTRFPLLLTKIVGDKITHSPGLKAEATRTADIGGKSGFVGGDLNAYDNICEPIFGANAKRVLKVFEYLSSDKSVYINRPQTLPSQNVELVVALGSNVVGFFLLAIDYIGVSRPAFGVRATKIA